VWIIFWGKCQWPLSYVRNATRKSLSWVSRKRGTNRPEEENYERHFIPKNNRKLIVGFDSAQYQRSRNEHLPSSTLHESVRIITLEDCPKNEKSRLKDETLITNPHMGGIIDYYFKTGIRNRNTVKAMYLFRNSLKVIGSNGLNLLPATLGIFYVNTEKPLSGETNHTIRMCEKNGVKVLNQTHWIKFFSS